MIPWRKYDKANDQMIIANEVYLVTDGEIVVSAVHAKHINENEGYGWHRRGGYRMRSVTHYAVINLPGEEEAQTGSHLLEGRDEA